MSATLSERHFSRIAFDAKTHIVCPVDNQTWPCTLLDISLHGALTSLPIYWPAKRGDSYRLEIQLGNQDEHDLRLNMNMKVAHLEVDHAGFEIVEMDVDTASHLHRLIELNSGDDAVLTRELAKLIKLHKTKFQ